MHIINGSIRGTLFSIGVLLVFMDCSGYTLSMSMYRDDAVVMCVRLFAVLYSLDAECEMDPIVAKLIQSRMKSIAILEDEIVRLRSIRDGSKVATVTASVNSVVLVKEQRLAKLREELRGFRQLADAQVEIPGTGTGEPPAPGPVMGRGPSPKR